MACNTLMKIGLRKSSSELKDRASAVRASKAACSNSSSLILTNTSFFMHDQNISIHVSSCEGKKFPQQHS